MMMILYFINILSIYILIYLSLYLYFNNILIYILINNFILINDIYLSIFFSFLDFCLFRVLTNLEFTIQQSAVFRKDKCLLAPF